MTALTLKSLPESLIERLRSAAAMTHRSLNKEIIHRLERSFERAESRTASSAGAWNENVVREQVAAWEGLARSWESDLSLEAEIEALYAARTEGRKVEL
jgi:plasmid stability protein